MLYWVEELYSAFAHWETNIFNTELAAERTPQVAHSRILIRIIHHLCLRYFVNAI